MQIRLNDSTVLVTGGTGALGNSVVRAFLDSGARVISTYVIEEEAILFRKEFFEYQKQVDLQRCDVRRSAEVEDLLQSIQPRHLRAVVNLAGGYQWTHLADADNKVLETLLDLNLRTTFTVCRAIAPVFKAAGDGAIVNVAARAAIKGEAGNGVYGATKAGVLALTQSLSEELKGHGINVNAVLPSIIDTPANRIKMPKSDPNKWVDPGDLAKVIVFLASREAKSIHGAAVPVYGLS